MSEKSRREIIEPRTSFDWVIYADATLAGLSVLIPIPLVDLLFETIFKRRMLGTIAKRNGLELDPRNGRIARREDNSIWPGCLLWPVYLTFELLKRLYRTVLYFLTIKASSDQLSLQWHRAFLFDYMIRRGDLDTPESAEIAAQAMALVLNENPTSPLIQLAQQITKHISNVLRAAWRFLRREREDEIIVNTRQEMEQSWGQFSGYLLKLGEAYDRAFAQLDAQQMQENIRVVNDTAAPQ